MLEEHIDYLVLGCSHYPFLIPNIRKILDNNITIIDSGEAVAKQTKAILVKINLLNTINREPQHHLYSNSNIKTLQLMVKEVQEHYSIEYLDF